MLAEIIRLRYGVAVILFIVLVPIALAGFDAIGPHGSGAGVPRPTQPASVAPPARP